MKMEKTVCDECGAVQGSANHWPSLQVWKSENTGVLALGTGKLGDLLELTRTAPPIEPETHDLCGEQCFYKHIGKLLKLNPVEGE